VRISITHLALVLGLAVGSAAFADLVVGDHLAFAKGGKKKPAKGSPKTRHRAASAPAASARPIERTRPYASCPPEMVQIRGHFCIDRHEAYSVDLASDRPLSPYYPPHQRLLNLVYSQWSAQVEREQTPGVFLADAGVVQDAGVPEGGLAVPSTMQMPLPVAPDYELEGGFSPKAVSKAGVTPQGYMPGFVASEACRNAGKRLCREEEWITACKGEQGRKFPYGDEYRQGVCNVFRSEHPAHILHGSASSGLTDPRLNQVMHEDTPLLRETGGSPLCVSKWGNDAVYDMVVNVDEWVDDPDGLFLGGFYSRSTRSGCEARVGAHGPGYFDYSTGYRCCADLASR